MGGTSTSTGKTEQQSQLQGWQPAMGDIQGILGKLDPAINNISGGDPLQQGVSQLIQNARQPNPLGTGAINAASSLLNGGANIGGAIGLLNRGYQGVSGALAPFLSGQIGQDPATAAAMSTLSSDVANQVNPMFAAAGRLGSPDNYQAVARGIAQGSTGILGKAMDDRLAAASALGNAANSAASGLTGADAANAGILGQGIGNAANAFGAQNLGANQLITAGKIPEEETIQNAMGILGPIMQLAGMFGTNTSSGTQTGSQTMSGAQQFATLAGGLANLRKAFSA